MASYFIFWGKIKERTVVIYQNKVIDFVRTAVMNHRNHPDNQGGRMVCVHNNRSTPLIAQFELNWQLILVQHPI
jgi:hypothetical protein